MAGSSKSYGVSYNDKAWLLKMNGNLSLPDIGTGTVSAITENILGMAVTSSTPMVTENTDVFVTDPKITVIDPSVIITQQSP